MYSSDSSMDDCNMWGTTNRKEVKISSDSSMDDCNETTGLDPLTDHVGSDSSMDDCNPASRAACGSRRIVQIPLWTIVTVDAPE